jgi:virginiamycin B lyase
MTFGPGGDLWYVSGTLIGQRVYEAIFQATASGVAMRAVFPSPTDAPVDMVAGSDGALWLVDAGADQIDRYVPGGTLTGFPAPKGPVNIVAGPDGALWFTETWPAIGRITPSGELSEFPLPAGSGPYGITVGPDGALWFAEWQAGAIGRMTTDGDLQQFPVPNASGRPAGADGPTPMHLAVGPDGAIWFTDPGDNSIGRVAGGRVTEYPVPPLAKSEEVQAGVSDAVPEAIADGPDGALWVTEANAKAIARVDPSGVPAVSAPTRRRTRSPLTARCSTPTRFAQLGSTKPRISREAGRCRAAPERARGSR